MHIYLYLHAYLCELKKQQASPFEKEEEAIRNKEEYKKKEKSFKKTGYNGQNVSTCQSDSDVVPSPFLQV